jgi:opacity protein-like surface antigen
MTITLANGLRPLATALAAFFLLQSPSASAADWNNGDGSLKDSGGLSGIAVPAPVPVPEVFNWYFRADITFAFASTAKARERGLVLGHDRASWEGGTFGLDAPFFSRSDDLGHGYGWGGGVGYYITPRLRADITVDARNEQEHILHGRYSYTQVDDHDQPIGRVRGRSNDHTTLKGALTMATLYWDLLPRGGRFTPYVGAGVGFAVHEVDRRHLTEERICTSCGTTARSFSGSDKGHAVSVAGAATTGVTWNIDPHFAVDFSYRYLMIGGFSTDITVANSADEHDRRRSVLRFSDQGEHQVRAGVRWNLF